MKIRLKSSKRLRPRVKVRIKRAFRNLEQAFLKASRDVLQDINLSFLAQAEKIVKDKDLTKVSSLDLDFSPFQNVLFNYLRECRRTGRLQGITEGLELKQFYQKRQKARKKLDQGIDHAVDDIIQQFIGELTFDNKLAATSFAIVPYDALKYYGDYSLFLTGDIESDLLKKAKQKIYSGIEKGLPTRDIMADLEPIFPFFSSGRLQNIARTETSRAMNQGRLEGFRAPVLDGFIVAVEFSSILDSRTTDYCDARNGLIASIWSEIIQKNLIPGHYYCRSVWVPVDKYSAIEEGLLDKIDKGWDNLPQFKW